MTARLRSFSRQTRFADLVDSVRHCDLCPRLCSRRKVLSKANGSIDARVLFVAEAPGRLGADRTGIPLHGDRTGENFEALLGSIGWKRESLFITNAVLCNPREEGGKNATPSTGEIDNCSAYLEMTIELVKPEVVVTLGTKALEALNRITSHGLKLKDSVSRPSLWAGRILVPLYHPGPRARFHRALANQRADFMRLAKIVDPMKGLRTRTSTGRAVARLRGNPASPEPVHQAVVAVVHALGKTTYFKLMKILYLIDLLALDTLGHSITGQVFLRQEEGPWAPSVRDAVAALDGHELRQYFQRRIPMVARGPSPRFDIELDDAALEIIVDVLDRCRSMSNSAIKTAVYMSAPMRYILGEERQGRDMRRVPLIYKDKTASALGRQDA